MKRRTREDEIRQEAYEQGWENGFKACLIQLQESLVDEIIKRHRIEEKKHSAPVRRFRI